jgi:hypothetical protein
MSDQRRQGAASRYLNGGASRLICDPRDCDDIGLVGCWEREKLIEMNERFVAAMERAIERGLECRSSAAASVRAGGGDLDRLPWIA